MYQKIFIADPALVDHRGHHFSLTCVVSQAFLQVGYKVIWLSHKSFNGDVLGMEAQIYPTFSESTYDAYKVNNSGSEKGKEVSTDDEGAGILKRLYRILPVSIREQVSPHAGQFIERLKYKFYPPVFEEEKVEIAEVKHTEKEMLKPEQELYRALRHHDCKGTDHILFHTCDNKTYQMIYSFFADNTIETEWKKFPVFHLSTPYEETVMPHNKARNFQNFLKRLSWIGALESRVFLYAENDRLAEHLSCYSDLPVMSLPIPAFDGFEKVGNVESGSDCVVTYLGAARTEKGFTALPEVVEKVLALSDEVVFLIQVSPQIMGYTQDVKQAVLKLKALEGRRVRLIEETQSPEQYMQSLAQSDVILLCYEKDRYKVRSSGIAVEAILNSASIIATKNTFPDYVSGESGVGIEPTMVDSIVSGITAITGSRQEYRERALRRRAEYLVENSVSNFTKKVLTRKGSMEEPEAVEYFDDTTPWKMLVS